MAKVCTVKHKEWVMFSFTSQEDAVRFCEVHVHQSPTKIYVLEGACEYWCKFTLEHLPNKTFEWTEHPRTKITITPH